MRSEGPLCRRLSLCLDNVPAGDFEDADHLGLDHQLEDALHMRGGGATQQPFVDKVHRYALVLGTYVLSHHPIDTIGDYLGIAARGHSGEYVWHCLLYLYH